MRNLFLAVASVLVLAGCSKGGSLQQHPVIANIASASATIPDTQRGLIYAYPALGQAEVPPAAPVVLRFSHPLQSGVDLTQLITIQPSAGGSPVSFMATTTPDGQGAVLQPTVPLTEATQYTIAGSAIPLVMRTGAIATVSLQSNGMPPLTFTTRPATEGPLQKLDAAFKVATMLPDPNSFLIGVPGYKPVDFSSLRLQLTQPIDPATAVYGSTVKLMTGGVLVPARLLVKQHDMTVDPIQDMDPTKTYVLTLTSGLNSTFGNSFAAMDYTFMPQRSGAQLSGAKVAISVPTSGISLLTGTAVNQVPVASPVLGQGAAAPRPQASGMLYADLAGPGPYTGVLPIRVPRGNILTAGNLEVKLSGQVPANLNTGNLTITLLSDANGLLLPNRYSNSSYAPSLVTLQMDIAVGAQDPTSNGAFTQRLMHVQVAGTATLDVNVHLLTIEAVGVIDLKVLGIDNAVGVLALKMQNDTLSKPVSMPTDTQAPTIQSWVPGNPLQIGAFNGLNGGEYLRPGDSLLVNFSKAMDEDSLLNPGAVTLTAAGVPVAANLRVDGSSLVVTPLQPLQHGVPYVLAINPQGSNGGAVTDIAGNPLVQNGVLWAPGTQFQFRLPALANSTTVAPARPPVALSVYPGYPCPIASGTRNVATGRQGQCAGGKTSDDQLPLPTMNQHKNILVAFSQTVNASSIKLGSSCGAAASFRVEQIDASGNCQKVVPGLLQVAARGLQFVPDQPWMVGQYYRYVLGSNNDLTSSAAVCDGTQSICGSNGLPLQTQLLAQETASGSPGITNPQHGGPAMEIWFQGVADDPSSSTIALRVLPAHDVDANFRLDAGERQPFSVGAVSNSLPVSSFVLDPTKTCTTGTSSGGQIGTDAGTATPGRCLASNGALLQPDNTSSNPDGTHTSYYGAATSFAIGCKAGKDSEAEGNTTGQSCQGNQFLLISGNLAASLAGYGQVTNPITGAAITGIKVNVSPTILLASGALIYASLGISSSATSITSALIKAANGLGLGGLVNPLTSFLNTGLGAVNGILPIVLKDLTNADVPQGAAFTGPVVLRLRYPSGASAIPGVIQSTTDASGNPQLQLTTWLDLYSDVPELNANGSIGGSIQALQIKHQLFSNTNLSGNGCDAQQGDAAGHCNGSGTVQATGTVKFLPDGRMTVRLSNANAPVKLTIPLSDVTGLLVGTLKVIVPTGRFVVDASLAPLKQ